MTRRILTVLLAAIAILVGAGAVPAREIQPHMAGWEQHFTLEYGPGEFRGKPVVEGTLTNISPYLMTRIGLLVDTLDQNGNITSQRVAWLPGDLSGGGHDYFSVPTVPAPAYRVRVYSYDRIEVGGD